jgi:hypothetical protein
MLDVFQELGTRIDREWGKTEYNDSDLPCIAANELVASQALLKIDADDLVRWIVSPQLHEVEQSYREFGQPPVNVYMGEHFYIEVLFWLDASPSIHQHSFVGAFGVLAGSSVQSEYKFEPRDSISREIMLGDIRFVASELLQRGDVRPISSGDSLIHSLFHLERPSLSLVIRTKGREHLKPQYRYVKPWLAVDPFHKPEPFMTQLRLLECLKLTNLPLFWTSCSVMIEHSTPWTLYMILSSAYHRHYGTPEWKQLLVTATGKHGNLVERLLPCLEEQEREIKIVARREKVHDPVYRFFLALLLNVPDRPSIYRLIGERFPESNPEQLVIQWIGEMAEKKLLGMDFNPVSLHLLECALHDAGFLEAKSSLYRTFRLENTEDEGERLRTLWNELLAVPLFRPLFCGGSAVPIAAASQEEIAVCQTAF